MSKKTCRNETERAAVVSRWRAFPDFVPPSFHGGTLVLIPAWQYYLSTTMFGFFFKL